MRNLEQELKLQLTEREYNILNNLAQKQAVEQINYYFAGEKLDKDVMIRLRKKNGAFLLCYKRRLSASNGVMVSDENECEVDADYAQTLILRGITAKQLNDFFHQNFSDDFTCVGALTTYRTKFALDEWNIELDKNEYFAVIDYELECESSQVQSLAKLKSYLTYNFGIVIRPSLTKFERFLTELSKQ